MVDAEMASCSNLPSADNAGVNDQNNVQLSSESPSRSMGNKDEGEGYDEDEDVDFNPFLKETPSPAASSSLSSEVEAFEGETINSQGNNSINSSRLSGISQSLDGGGDDRHGEEERAVQSNALPEGPCDKDSQKSVQWKCKMKNPESLSCTGGDNLRDKESDTNVMGEMNESGREMCDMIRAQKSALNLSEEDAICMRTRARYSLASITLDELEAFLQETDDEDDIQNVNDEEEYRKFLAAVLHGGHDEGSLVQKHENSDDDDEDNDADFEIELEEALESDDDEGVTEKARRSENSSSSRRPTTRHNRQQNISIQRKWSSPEQAKRLLRPLVPILPTGPVATLAGRHSVAGTNVSGDCPINGFTQTQKAELRSLIHDHVQLLIQVYSLAVLDPSRQHIATQVQGLISEMLCKREESVSCQSQPHSFVTRPTTSILAVSPLDLARKYLDDVSSAVRDYRRCQVESGCDASSDRVPLFPLPQSDPCHGVGSQVLNSASTSMTSHLPSGQQQSKKTLAATLVESAKKQSVALVQKNIAELAQRFCSLFNPSLFPHKPPPAAVTNRVLFTDAEDELLALGIMECNSDWKAIQQRFLPCKSKHQIFVRQKNRCSSKALENPIKAVRRMKSSPLTAEEISRIQEGLKYFKFDWMSVWKFIVPHRDPALLPRQWRIALGVQKSYKQDSARKEKRRLYELKRKSRASLTNEQLVSNTEDCHDAAIGNENNVGDLDNSGEAFVHRGFLADWRPDTPHIFYSRPLYSLDKEKNVHDGSLKSVEEIRSGERSENPESSNAQLLSGSVQRFPPTLMPPGRFLSGSAPVVSRPQIILRPYRARRLYNSRVVRLAPELPPVNLPPSVRVISQSVFSKNQSETSKPHNVKGGIFYVSGSGNVSSQPPRVAADKYQSCPPNDKMVDLQRDKSGAAEDTCALDESNTDSDLQMHPLLFRIPENGQLACYSSSSRSGGSSSFSFFSDHRPQLLSLFNSPRQVSLSVDQLQKVVTSDEHDAASGDIGFHPLLQRIEYPNNNLFDGISNPSLSVGIKVKSGQHQDASGSVKNISTANVGLVGVGSQPSSSSGKAKMVDLDIHLSSSSRKVCRNSAANNSEGHNMCAMQHSPANYSEAPGSAAPGHDIINCMDAIGENSNLGIVMEQEELSDSDEDMEEENVEFECEEMTDSEGEEGSECEQMAGMQNKDHRSSAVEKAESEPDAGNEIGLANLTSSQCKISDPSVGGIVSSSSSAAELGKDSRSSPWLSLELDMRSVSKKAGKRIDRKTADELANETMTALSSPSGSCKKRTPAKRRGSNSKEDVGIARLLSLGPLATPVMKKPRNRVSRANTNIDIDATLETSQCDDKDRACSS